MSPFTIYLNEINLWFKAFLIVVGDYIGAATYLVFTFIEFFSQTVLFARLRTVCIFGASFVLFTCIAILIGKDPVQHPDVGLSLHEFCAKQGYIIQNETVQTEDDYILTMHRIKCSGNNTFCENRPPVLFMHGMFGSSADFVAAKNQSLAFQLADKGYDVWLGNNRGNTYSRDHVMLDPNDDKSFWDYSYHEIAIYDIPAMIDHVIARTTSPQITYIGMSQGSTAFFAMSSLKPEYNKKIKLANLLAPATPFASIKSIVFQVWSLFNYFVEWILYFTGPFEVLGDTNQQTALTRYFCLGPHKIANYMCIEIFLKYAIGFSDQKNYDIFPFHLSVTPAGVSIKQLQHLVQNYVSGTFVQYDYHNKNQEIYNQDTPPIYNVSRTTAPVAVYFGKADLFVSVEGLYHQLKLLPNVVLRYKVPYDQFNHMDFILATDLNHLLNNKVIEMIDTYNNRSSKQI